MDLERLLHFVFVLYCATTGVVFLLLPWSPGYDQLLALLPFHDFDLLRHPALRGAISGFGVVHLVWGVHDLTSILQRRLPSSDVDSAA